MRHCRHGHSLISSRLTVLAGRTFGDLAVSKLSYPQPKRAKFTSSCQSGKSRWRSRPTATRGETSLCPADRHSKPLCLIVSSWLVLWVLIAPLFHLHTLGLQESRSLFQPLLTHTVFSPDLPGEYTPRNVIHRGPVKHRHDLSTRVPNYSEIEISLFSEAKNKKKSGIGTTVFAPFSPLSEFLQTNVQKAILDFATPRVFLLLSSALSRAPPFVTS